MAGTWSTLTRPNLVSWASSTSVVCLTLSGARCSAQPWLDWPLISHTATSQADHVRAVDVAGVLPEQAMQQLRQLPGGVGHQLHPVLPLRVGVCDELVRVHVVVAWKCSPASRLVCHHRFYIEAAAYTTFPIIGYVK